MAETLPRSRYSSPPRARTRLLGRQDERAAAREALLEEDAPLLSLIGPGGVGKTRLALAIAEDVEDAFVDGLIWVDLAPLSDPALVPGALADALDLPLTPDQPMVEALVHYLRPWQALLLLDNCEHVVHAVADLAAALLAGCPALQGLATSRSPLRVRGEHEFSVEPLPLPPATSESFFSLAQNEAVALFAERARAVRPSFMLTEESAPSVAALCRRLDGLPLAIELAAARSRILSPEALLAQMTDRLRLLSGGPRDLPARQQTIEATVAWSHDLLDAGARQLFRRLAVFAGGCDLDAVMAVTDGDSFVSVSALEALRDQGLLRVVDDAGGTRYAMLEVVREYALARLEERGEVEAAREAHAAHFLALAEQAEPHFRGPELSRWLDRIDTDYPNLRAAMVWLCERGDAERAWRLGGALCPFWQMRNRFTEGRQRLEEALALPGFTRTTAWAKARTALGFMTIQSYHAHDLPRARALLEEALAVWEALGDQRGYASALEELMAVALNEGHLDQARARGEEALAIYRALDDDYGVFKTLWVLGIAAMQTGELVRSRVELDEALRLAGALGPTFPYFLSRARGWLAVAEGDERRAVAIWEERLARDRAIGNDNGVAGTLDDLGWLAHRRREWARAGGCFAEELALGAKLGDEWYIVRGLLGLAMVSAQTGALERAAWLFGAADAATESNVIDVDTFNPIREPYERVLAATRRALGEAAFAEAWQAGRRLPRQQAIIRALADAPLTDEASSPHAPALFDRLTRREKEVLQLVARRQTDGEIAETLFISRRTASSHVARILEKLGARNRREAGAVAVQLGLV